MLNIVLGLVGVFLVVILLMLAVLAYLVIRFILLVRKVVKETRGRLQATKESK